MALLSVDNLQVHFHTRKGIIRAVENLSYSIELGETLGVVGESGSGKSVSHYALLGLLPTPPAKVESGTAKFQETDLLQCTAKQHREIRGAKISMIFQDPMTALNPYMKIGKQIMEPLLLHKNMSKAEARQSAIDELLAVGIQDPEARMNMYPHEFSGGMRQRVMIAMALITRPDLLIADEPTTALDVTVQSQILELIRKRQEELGMAVVLITHDLGVVAEVCNRVLVMYAGRVMETTDTKTLFQNPSHPYTKALLASIPGTRMNKDTLYSIPGLPPDSAKNIDGCPFAPRCEFAQDICQQPMKLSAIEDTHFTACARVQDGLKL